jgi:hypothetical protein
MRKLGRRFSVANFPQEGDMVGPILQNTSNSRPGVFPLK